MMICSYAFPSIGLLCQNQAGPANGNWGAEFSICKECCRRGCHLLSQFKFSFPLESFRERGRILKSNSMDPFSFSPFLVYLLICLSWSFFFPTPANFCLLPQLVILFEKPPTHGKAIYIYPTWYLLRDLGQTALAERDHELVTNASGFE